MFTSKSFKGKTELTRKGVLGKVEIPENLLNAVALDFEIDRENKVIKFTEGEEVFVLTDKFGVGEKSDYTVFLVDGGFIINVLYGKVYLKDEDNDVVYAVDDYGDVSYPRIDKAIKWIDTDSFIDYAEKMTQSYYALPDRKTTLNYIDNLGFGITTEYLCASKAKGEPCFCIRFKDYYSDLGNGEFVFVKYADSEFNEEGSEAVSYKDFEDTEEEPENIEIEEGFEDAISLGELETEDSDDDDDGYYM